MCTVSFSFFLAMFLNRALNDEIPIGIHYVMFLPTIEVGALGGLQQRHGTLIVYG